MITRTSDDIPADPLNVGLVGNDEDVVRAMNTAGWFAADAVTLRSSVEIVGSVVLDRPYRNAPVSPLYYLGKKQQYAFEKPAGRSADRRNHVRFWKALEKGDDGRPVWLGSATFDRGVGLSHDTGQVTHHIAANIDAERDLLMADLRAARVVGSFFQISGIGPTLFGRNGGGDPYYTDGEIHVAVLVPGAANGPADPPTIPRRAQTDRRQGNSSRHDRSAGVEADRQAITIHSELETDPKNPCKPRTTSASLHELDAQRD